MCGSGHKQFMGSLMVEATCTVGKSLKRCVGKYYFSKIQLDISFSLFLYREMFVSDLKFRFIFLFISLAVCYNPLFSG